MNMLQLGIIYGICGFLTQQDAAYVDCQESTFLRNRRAYLYNDSATAYPPQ